MTALDLSQVELKRLITHRVGNKALEEPMMLSEEETILDEDTRELLLSYFLKPMKPEAFFAFKHAVELEMNEVYGLVKGIFSELDAFIAASQNITKLLFEYSNHPKIKRGELNVAYFSNLILGDELLDAIGIYKSETDAPFLKMEPLAQQFKIEHEYGFELKSIDKGCLIFNTGKAEGYRMLIIDNANKSSEAVYWKDDFLRVEPIANEYYQTQQFLNLTKEYITTEFSTDFNVSKADQADMLNRSVQYFKENDTFEQQTFEQSVLQDDEVIQSFRNFDETYSEDHQLERSDQFAISTAAVKKQARHFKSIIKLDKNFHIYIHGDKNQLERGVDDSGRKYYKLYFEEEH